MNAIATQQHRLSTPNLILRAEGFAIFAASIVLYAYIGGNGWVFAALLLTPDVAMLGYLRSVGWGSFFYNSVHSIVLPTAMILIALASGSLVGIQLALIWFAHIGMDRTVGYGLKYATAFKDTHMERV